MSDAEMHMLLHVIKCQTINDNIKPMAARYYVILL